MYVPQIILLMKTTKKGDYMAPESEAFKMQAEKIICVSGGGSEKPGDDELDSMLFDPLFDGIF